MWERDQGYTEIYLKGKFARTLSQHFLSFVFVVYMVDTQTAYCYTPSTLDDTNGGATVAVSQGMQSGESVARYNFRSGVRVSEVIVCDLLATLLFVER